MDCAPCVLQSASLCGVALVLWFMVHSYLWRNSLRNIPGPRSKSFITGNMAQFFGPESISFQRDIVESFRSRVLRLNGILGRPILYIYDSKALHAVLVRDSDSFEQSGRLISINKTLVGPGMVATVDRHHRAQRKMLNPIFTANRMRCLLPVCYDIVFTASDTIVALLANGPRQMDIHSWTTRIALEAIGRSGLDHSFDSLVDDTRCEFGRVVVNLIPSIARLGQWMGAVPLIHRIPVPIRQFLGFFPTIKAGHELRLVMDAIVTCGRRITDYRKLALREGYMGATNPIARDDFMSTLIKANTDASAEDQIPDREVVAQTAVLLVTATDTTASTVARILELLAHHRAAQERLRTEAIDAWRDGELTYGRLMQLPYLDAIYRETMRLYPPANWVIRDATKDTVLPLSTSIVGADGTVMDEIPIPKGCEVIIGILGANTSKDIWGEDSLEWKPERWLDPLPSSVAQNTLSGVSPNLMSFSGGKRACIGWRFAEMEIKAILSIILPRLTFAPGDEEIVWRAAHVVFPTIRQDVVTPQLPLQVGLYNAAVLH